MNSRRGQGVRPDGGTGRRARRLRPRPVRPGLPDGPPADRAGVSFVEVTLGSVGNDIFGWDTHQNNFTAVEGALGRARRRLGHADEGAGRARPARLDDDPLDRRVRPHAQRSTRKAAATTSPPPGPASSPAAASRAARPTARRATAARKSPRARSMCPTSWPRSAPRSASIPRRKTSPSRAGPIKIAEGKPIQGHPRVVTSASAVTTLRRRAASRFLAVLRLQ